MWRLALMVTAQLVLLSSADESNLCIPGVFAFQPQQAVGPAACSPLHWPSYRTRMRNAK